MQKSHRLWVRLATSGFLAMGPVLVSAQGAGIGGGTGNTSGGATSTGTGQGRSSTGSSMEIGQGHRITAPTERDKSNMTTNPRNNEPVSSTDAGQYLQDGREFKFITESLWTESCGRATSKSFWTGY